MLDRRFVEENPELVRTALAARGSELSLDALLKALSERRDLLAELELLQARRNAGSKEVGAMFKAGRGDEAQALRSELAELGKQVSAGEARVRDVEVAIDQELLQIPNLVAADVPLGRDESANVEIRTWGEPRSFEFEVRDHHDLGEQLGVLDFERGARVAGARFTALFGAAARLNRALVQFMLDLHTGEHGYTEVLPPFIVNDSALTGTGQLPKFADDLFRLHKPDNYYLIPTAEVPVTNLHAGELLSAAQVPLRYCAYTPCFRAEAGSYGRDTRGLIRQHQFEKVELVQLVRPEDSEAAHEALTAHAERVLQLLELPYRVVSLCSGDIGFSAWKCYDLEVWLPAQETYREISSCSNFRDFQSRRAGLRFRPEPGARPQFLHTLNGSGLAVGRTLVAIFENYQSEDGSVVIPNALRPYMGGIERISAAK
ncbi:MAG: serine--tRNA ligase [Rickettsiales bacterium]|nr:serine--tRNA ligase [Rickettsiales bacterium]